MDRNTVFLRLPPVKLFFLAAIPGGISMLASSLYGLLDGIFVGRILGGTAFAALNLAFPFVIINFSLADLIGVGSAVPISIHLGKKEAQKANNIFSCACLMIVITGVLMGVILFSAAPALLHLLGADGELADLAVQYMRVYALCSPVTTIVFAMDNFLRICGRIRGSMCLNLLMSALSAGFELLFLGVFGFGIWGAALATCSGMLICAAISFYPFLRGKLQLHLCRPRFTLSMIRQIIFCGSPEFLSNISGRITSVLFNTVFLRVGGANAVSVYGVLMYMGETLQSVLYGICDSLQPAVGYNWGAGRKDRVRIIEVCSFTASAGISIFFAFMIYLFPAQLASLFIKDADLQLMGMAVTALRIFSLTFVTRWFSFAIKSYMTAVDKPGYAAILSVSSSLVFPLLLIAVLWPLGINGLWLNFPVTYGLAAALGGGVLLRFKQKERRETCACI